MDSVERKLLEAHALVDSIVATHAAAEKRQPVTTVGDDHGSVHDALTTLLGSAKYAVGVILPHGGEQTESVLAAIRDHGADRPASVMLRLLCTPEVLDSTALGEQARRVDRSAVRVLERDAHAALIVDGRVALTWSARSSLDGAATLVTDLATAKALDLLFARVWRTGRPLAEYLRTRERLDTDMTRRVLLSLRAGHTDAVSASAMSVSLRTYRRHVAKIMRDMGADSRFQAGVRSVELGLLPARR
ncbi:helix-turn-helix transcriptional regulator [Streptomyces profundus]|uniref:helix-turn-helix transcriptional regulator n=1 Tax=Streptomyces profundus TaxID=2867410 RepID=UPI001D16AF85|nr:hypothetical protein [Streptomyces sp. MA3_2.13]UED87034.1 hypothetical protein K4G22_24865 [Streptomyces sp. MA3_2.13]